LVEDGEAAVKELYLVNAGRKRKGIGPNQYPQLHLQMNKDIIFTDYLPCG